MRVGRVSEDPHEDVRVGVGVGVGVVEKPRPADMTGLGVGHEEDDSDVLHAGLLIERGEVVLEVELFVALLERDLEHLETGDEGGEARQALLAAAADADEQCVAARSLEDAAARSLSALPRGPSRTRLMRSTCETASSNSTRFMAAFSSLWLSSASFSSRHTYGQQRTGRLHDDAMNWSDLITTQVKDFLLRTVVLAIVLTV